MPRPTSVAEAVSAIADLRAVLSEATVASIAHVVEATASLPRTPERAGPGRAGLAP